MANYTLDVYKRQDIPHPLDDPVRIFLAGIGLAAVSYTHLQRFDPAYLHQTEHPLKSL